MQLCRVNHPWLFFLRCNGFHVHEKKIGRTVDLDLAFTTPLIQPINLLVYATYETEIKLLGGQTIEANFING